MHISDEGIRKISVGINNITPWEPKKIVVCSGLINCVALALKLNKKISTIIKTVNNNNDNK